LSNRKLDLRAVVTIITLVVSIFSSILAGFSWITSLQANTIAIQGNSIAVQANSIAYSAYSVVNNYPPYIDVSSAGLLILRLVNCSQDVNNVTCHLGGTVRISFEIMAPHLGIANVTRVALSGIGPFSRPAQYQIGVGPESVRVDNATIIVDPPMRVVSSSHATVLAAQPVKGAVEAVVAGLTVTLPSTSMGALNATGFCTITVFLTYFDIQLASSVSRSLPIQAQITMVPA
jgi:hypothetical protein